MPPSLAQQSADQCDITGMDTIDIADRHHLIVVYKTAFYSFYLPVALAMRMVRTVIYLAGH